MRIRYLLVVAVLTLLPGRGSADYIFEFFDPVAGTFTNNFTLNVGASANVQVYLAQTGSTTTLTTGPGLKAGGVALSFNQTIANVTSTSAISPSSAFDTSTKSVGTGTAGLNVFQTTSSPVLAPTTGPTANAILLGTFTFTGVSAGSTLALTAEPHPAPFQNNVLGDGTGIDSLIANSSAVITVVAVPEPGSLVLTGLAASAISLGIWRRRRVAA
jgi:hypothetical protein